MRGEWQRLAEVMCNRMPTHTLPLNQADTNHTMEPNDYDHQPIFGPTTVETLLTTLNQLLIDSNHQQLAAAYTLRYGAFIAKPERHQGFNTVPLPTFNWLVQTNLAALRTSMNDVISTCPPICDIPPTSTTTLYAALCQLFVTKGANFKTQIQVNVTETEPNHYAISYSLTFVQNTNYNLTTTIQNEEEFLDSTGLCHVPLMTLYTQCSQVLAAATTGDTFMTGCEAIATFILAQCHDTHFNFAKWLIEPGSAHFFLVPDATLCHTTVLLATLMQDIMPTNHINMANRTNPQSTYCDNHTDRPLLRIVMGSAYRRNMGQHDQIWNITLHLIHAIQNHPNWIEHPTHHPGSRTTDTSASSTTAPASPEPAPLQRTEQIVAGSGPTTAKGPPPMVIPTPALPKPSPPQPPEDDAFAG
jgi:hypothetical protein